MSLDEFKIVMKEIQNLSREINQTYKDETWTIKFTRYERDNLLRVLELIMNEHNNPFFSNLNTGDWVGQIKCQLSDSGGEITQANDTREGYLKRINMIINKDRKNELSGIMKDIEQSL